jgi:hypothetical protein
VAQVRPAVCVFGGVWEGWGAERVVWRDDRRAPPKRTTRREKKHSTTEREEGKVLDVDTAGIEVIQAVGEGQETLMVNASLGCLWKTRIPEAGLFLQGEEERQMAIRKWNNPIVVDIDVECAGAGAR